MDYSQILEIKETFFMLSKDNVTKWKVSEGYNIAGFEDGGRWPQDKECKCL